MSDPLSPRDYLEALAWFQSESKKPFGSAPTPSHNWGGYCLMDFRISYGIPPQALTAWAAWLTADPDSKHVTTDLSEAPLGAALITKGSNPAGHVYFAARPFKNGTPGAWSNDLRRYGLLDKVARNAPAPVWGHQIVGWMDECNGYDLRLKEKKPPKPKQDKPYKGIALAIDRLEDARVTAHTDGDENDVRLLNIEISHLKKRYAALRHS